MQLILARHGNTFGPGDAVVWVGARTDLPLVEKGRAQAEAIADGLIAAGLVPSRIYAGPLRRTAETARIVARICELPAEAVVTSAELREIDYGRWEARSSDEIRAEVGDAPIDGWQKESIWPVDFNWLPGEANVKAGWDTLVERIRRENTDDAIILVVSSNGVFRIVAKALGLPAAEAKMDTGSVAYLVLAEGNLEIVGWNLDPSRLNV